MHWNINTLLSRGNREACLAEQTEERRAWQNQIREYRWINHEKKWGPRAERYVVKEGEG